MTFQVRVYRNRLTLSRHVLSSPIILHSPTCPGSAFDAQDFTLWIEDTLSDGVLRVVEPGEQW